MHTADHSKETPQSEDNLLTIIVIQEFNVLIIGVTINLLLHIVLFIATYCCILLLYNFIYCYILLVLSI